MKRILITGVDQPIAGAVVAALESTWSVRRPEGDLRDPAVAAAAVAGIDTVVHLAPLDSPGADHSEALDQATRGTYTLVCAAIDAGVQRIIVGSSLNVFERLPSGWHVTESWRPRPAPVIEQLVPWLAEICVREATRATHMQAIGLRFGQIVDGQATTGIPDSRWLHQEDAVAGVLRAVAFTPAGRQHGWWMFHITAAGRGAKVRLADAGKPAFAYTPAHDFDLPPPEPDQRPWREVLAPTGMPSRPIRRVVVFGAGGPLASETAAELESSYTLRLTDVRPIDLIAAEGVRQGPGAPLPKNLPPPHESLVVDVRDPVAVMGACAGMDAIINASVVRHLPVEAFLVNTLGAYNVMRAAVAHGIRRVVHTGPFQFAPADPTGYWWDEEVPADAPARPGRELYILSKYLGQEICRVFAEYYGLEVPALLFAQFANPEIVTSLYPFAVSWRDGARAIRRALEVPALPQPYETFSITIDQPHGRYSSRRARETLGWEARDTLDHLWNGTTSQE